MNEFKQEASEDPATENEREELKRLRKKLRMEKEILKKASPYFAKEMKSTAWMQEVEQRRCNGLISPIE